jgi:hypothetical protein
LSRNTLGALRPIGKINPQRSLIMIGKFKTLLVAALVIGSATAATAQPAYYYYSDSYGVPAEQHRFYDRNSVDFNS